MYLEDPHYETFFLMLMLYTFILHVLVIVTN